MTKGTLNHPGQKKFALVPPCWRLTLYVNDPLSYSNLDWRITEIIMLVFSKDRLIFEISFQETNSLFGSTVSASTGNPSTTHS